MDSDHYIDKEKILCREEEPMLDPAFFKDSNLSFFNISSPGASKKSKNSAQSPDESIVGPTGRKLIEAEQAKFDQFKTNLLSI